MRIWIYAFGLSIVSAAATAQSIDGHNIIDGSTPLSKLVKQSAGTVLCTPSGGGTASSSACTSLPAIDASSTTTTAGSWNSTARTPADRTADFVNVKDMGAKGDGRYSTPVVTIAASSTTLTVGTATFAATDVGKAIIVGFASPAGNSDVMGSVYAIPVNTDGGGY